MAPPLPTRRVVGMLVSLCLTAVSSLSAQETRDDMLREARRQYDDFQDSQAIELLQRAVNPAIGPTDSTWGAGVQLLAQILLSTGREAEANAWLRWALRLAPEIQADSINFLPPVVAAFHAAREFVHATLLDSLSRTSWEWSARFGGFGDLRIESSLESAQAMVEGVGFLDPGQTRTLAPGSYRVVARADGFLGIDVSAEVLPGVTTVLRLEFAAEEGVLTAQVQNRVMHHLVRLTASRLDRSSCAVGFFTGQEGQVVTSYRAIRGAERLEIQLSDGRRLTDDVRISAYDVNADFAVVNVSEPWEGGLSVTTDVADQQYAWSMHYADCGTTPTADRLQVSVWESRPRGVIRLRDTLPTPEQSAPLIDRDGSVLGLASTLTSVQAMTEVFGLLEESSRNTAAGVLFAASEVARRENHRFGEVLLRSDLAGAVARVSPLESWQWPDVARTDSLPFTFVGPMGRYQVELLVGGTVRDRTEVTIEAGTTGQVALAPPRGRFPIAVPIVAALAGVGAAVALLAGGGGGDGPPPPVGGTGIIIRFP